MAAAGRFFYAWIAPSTKYGRDASSMAFHQKHIDHRSGLALDDLMPMVAPARDAKIRAGLRQL
jgi:hypothetical protein